MDYLFTFLLAVGSLYSFVGAFCGALYFIRTKGDRAKKWFVAGLIYLMWPIVVFDREAREVAFSRGTIVGKGGEA